MLNNFFRINLPYGIAKNDNDEWMAFNREYMPLGYNNIDYKGHVGHNYNEVPIYTKYKRLTEKVLIEIAHGTDGVQRNDKGEINKVFFYDDASNPVNQSKDKKELWDEYFDKLKNFQNLKNRNNN
ncbi:hypothetical protein [Flavobacterium sp.]|uniref:hypothetical protein n=1 Tax=Flavobacterium sp. TaxID=239 RepID=UPI003753680A